MLREVKDVIQECAAQKTALVLLSPGGRGAPALADLLAALGCDAPASARRCANNVADFNKAILDSSGTPLNHWSGFNAKWMASPKAAEFLSRALELLQNEFDGSYLSVMHDTATVRLLPFWNVVFDRAGIVPRYVFVTCDPADVAEDLKDRFDIERGAAQLVWLRGVLDAEIHSRGRLRAFTDAYRLNQDPVTGMSFLADTLKLTFPRDLPTTFAADDNCLLRFSELVRRNNESVIRDMSQPVMSEWVRVTHEILSDWAVNGESDEARMVLDALREAFDEAAPMFLGVGQGSTANSCKVRELEQELEKLQTEIGRAKESVLRIEEEARNNIIKAETKARAAEEFGKEAQKELKGRISYLESALAQRTAEVDETWKLLTDARSEIRTTKQELESSRNAASLEIGELRKSGADSEQALAEAQEQLRARYSEIVTLSRMLATETSSARKFERTAERLAQISQALERGSTPNLVTGWLRAFMPFSWHARQMRRYLEREGLFDAAAYLAANPDVQSAGVDPFRHYISHGALEGRPLGIG